MSLALHAKANFTRWPIPAAGSPHGRRLRMARVWGLRRMPALSPWNGHESAHSPGRGRANPRFPTGANPGADGSSPVYRRIAARFVRSAGSPGRTRSLGMDAAQLPRMVHPGTRRWRSGTDRGFPWVLRVWGICSTGRSANFHRRNSFLGRRALGLVPGSHPTPAASRRADQKSIARKIVKRLTIFASAY